VPIYEYRCRKCEHKFDVLQKVGEDGTNLECPVCQTENPERIFSVFSGGGSEKAAQACGSSKFT
jgi:putative FmdB family regulatory protein